MAKVQAVIPVERIASRIYLIRGEKVMLDSDLAELYGVATKVLVQAVKRNIERFPDDFMFQFSGEELENWRSQIVTSNPGAKMGLRRRPYAFTELGVAMLSTVLRSKRAVKINIAIMRTFVKLREILATHKDLARKVEEHDRQIAVLFSSLQKLLAPPESSKKHPIGYVHPKD
jgi:ORF6N domain